VKVHWSPRALEQAETAFDHIAEDRPQGAAGWLHGLFERVDLLREFPEQGRHLPEIARSDLREVIYETHRIVYRVDPDGVAVLLVHPTRIPMAPDQLESPG
jgi:toxin ParE1/3/4